MCGISGILRWSGSRPDDLPIVHQMIASLDHRGPDGKGLYVDDWMSMGHARLSIIDPNRGFQPLSNEDNTLWMVCNGEIFNYIELRANLRKQGHRFSTNSDVEVILHLYETYQDDFVEYLNGQFAIALWDSKNMRLLLVRDHVGICPLYYCRLNDGLAFASEIKALFQIPEIPHELDVPGLLQTFTFWSPLPGDTPFQQVREVKPGCALSLSKSRMQEKRWWHCDFSPDPDEILHDSYEAVQILQQVLTDAVNIRLRADVAVGAYLSGGLDSSITTALIKTISPGHLKTFSIGFSNPQYDETPFQDSVVNHLNTDHARLFCRDEDIAANLAQVVWHAEKPLLRTAPVPLFMLSRLVQEEAFKVVLTGEGADEYFSGYNIYKETKIRTFIAQQPSSQYRSKLLQRIYPYLEQKLTRNNIFWQNYFLQDLLSTQDPFYSHKLRWQIGLFIKQFLHPDVVEPFKAYNPLDDLQSRINDHLENLSPLARAHYLETTIFLPGYLLCSQGDRMLMSHGVEGRYPFLDKRVIALATHLAPTLRLKALKEKWILKKAFAHLLPAPVVQRAKQPYRAPIRGMVQTGENLGWTFLSPERINKGGLFHQDRVALLKRKFLDTKTGVSARDEMAVLAIITSHMLQDRFIRDEGLACEDNRQKYLTIDKRADTVLSGIADGANHVVA